MATSNAKSSGGNGQPTLADVHPTIAAEYERWRRQISSEMAAVPYAITTDEVLRAHFHLAEYFREKGEGLGGVGPRSLHLLQSAVGRQYDAYGLVRKWTELTDITATLFFGLVRDHPFHDSNKRTALLTALYQMHCNGRTPSSPQKEFELLTVRVAERSLDLYPQYERFCGEDDADVRFISHFLRRNTREIDKRHYIITYKQLDTILRRYGGQLANPHANKVDVMFPVKEVYGILGRTRTVEKRVLQIGFHDWGTEVSRREVNDVRKATGLVPERGVDSPVFYEGTDPMEALIAVYSGPLTRLANK